MTGQVFAKGFPKLQEQIITANIHMRGREQWSQGNILIERKTIRVAVDNVC
jgi:hypothetical protein